MKTRLFTISDEASVFEAASKMRKHEVGSLIVFNGKNKKPYGIVTDTDIVRRALAKKKTSIGIKSIISKPLVGIAPDADLSDAAKLMGSENIKRLVVFQGNKIVGLISASDIVRISPSLYDLIAERIK